MLGPKALLKENEDLVRTTNSALPIKERSKIINNNFTFLFENFSNLSGQSYKGSTMALTSNFGHMIGYLTSTRTGGLVLIENVLTGGLLWARPRKSAKS